MLRFVLLLSVVIFGFRVHVASPAYRRIRENPVTGVGAATRKSRAEPQQDSVAVGGRVDGNSSGGKDSSFFRSASNGRATTPTTLRIYETTPDIATGCKEGDENKAYGLYFVYGSSLRFVQLHTGRKKPHSKSGRIGCQDPRVLQLNSAPYPKPRDKRQKRRHLRRSAHPRPPHPRHTHLHVSKHRLWWRHDHYSRHPNR